MKEIIATLAAERGVSPEALRKWLERGKVPPSRRFDLFIAAKSKGVHLTESDFVFKSSRKSNAKKRRAA